MIFRDWSEEIQSDFFVRLFTGGRLFLFRTGLLGLMLLLDIMQGMQVSHFFWIASVIFAHQKCRATRVILLMTGCPLSNRLNTSVRRFFGTTILSSRKTRANLLDSFLLCFGTHLVSSRVVVSPVAPEFLTGWGRLWFFHPQL